MKEKHWQGFFVVERTIYSTVPSHWNHALPFYFSAMWSGIYLVYFPLDETQDKKEHRDLSFRTNIPITKSPLSANREHYLYSAHRFKDLHFTLYCCLLSTEWTVLHRNLIFIHKMRTQMNNYTYAFKLYFLLFTRPI